MNKKITTSVVLGLMCFALTLGMFIQAKTVKGSNIVVSQNYEENELRAEVLKYKEKYDNKYKDLEKAEQELEKQREISTENNGGIIISKFYSENYIKCVTLYSDAKFLIMPKDDDKFDECIYSALYSKNASNEEVDPIQAIGNEIMEYSGYEETPTISPEEQRGDIIE